MENESSLLNPEEFDNSLDSSSKSTVVANSDAEMSDLDKLRSEFLAFKMFAAEQFYLLKQSVGIPKQTAHTSSNSEVYISYLNEQIQYLKEENKTKNSIIQSLLQHSPCSHDSFSRKDVDYDKNSKISPDSFLDERSPLIGNNLNDLKDDGEVNTHNKEVKVTQKDLSNDQNQRIPLNQTHITTRKKKKRKKITM